MSNTSAYYCNIGLSIITQACYAYLLIGGLAEYGSEPFKIMFYTNFVVLLLKSDLGAVDLHSWPKQHRPSFCTP